MLPGIKQPEKGLCCQINPEIRCSKCSFGYCLTHLEALSKKISPYYSISLEKIHQMQHPECKAGLWWEVWREALFQSKILQEENEKWFGKPKEAFSYIMGYSKEDQRGL